jgi:RES domain-containing protein
MPDLRAFFREAPARAFSGVVYRLCPARFAGQMLSMRGALLHGARYNIRGYFGALYTSISPETARREMARYFTVPPEGGFVEATIRLRLRRVADLTDRELLSSAGIDWEELIGPRTAIAQEVGLRAWESGMEALLAPSAADPAERNLAVLLDNQQPQWAVELASIGQAS